VSNNDVLLVTDEGEFAFDEVVVAAGIWSVPLVKPLGVKNMVVAERGYHLMLQHPGISLHHPIIAGEHKFAITPLNKGIRLAGTSEFAAVDAAPDWRRADLLFPLAQQLFPNLDGASTATRWMGTRPSMPDSLPLVGRTPKNPRIICAFGHGHLGLTLGAVTASQVADILAGRDPEFPTEALDPARF
jgi:D-amino-acid dehydrogenase